MARLYVASHRLHSTTSRHEVLSGIEEIVTNLVGSEELVVLERDEHGNLKISTSFGIRVRSFEDLADRARDRIAACLASGEIWVRRHGDGEAELTACIPLLVDGHVRGAIVIFRMLAQKPEVEPADHDLFGLLATHAAMALYCSALHAAQSERVM